VRRPKSRDLLVRAILAAVVLVLSAPGLRPAAAQPAAAADPRAALLARTDQIAGEVSRLRGLKILRPIKRGVMSRDQITARLLQRVRQEYKPEEIAAEEMALKRLGLFPADKSYLDVVIELLKSQIAGFYDPWEKQLYIADWTGGGDEVMAHEIDHALQDQHFDLARWMKGARDNADATLARQALVEGDGTALMLEYAAAQSGQPVPWGRGEFVGEVASSIRMGMLLMGEAPLVLRESLVFPYVNGLKFVAHARRTGSWKAIDAMYRKPPLSTEHIIHPDKYESYERPVQVTSALPATLAGYSRGYDNVLGELSLWIFLREHGVDEAQAKVAVAGWGGDRVAVFTPPGYDGVVSSAVAVVYTVWDAEPDAHEFMGALGTALPALGGKARATPSRRGDVIELRGADGSVLSAELRGDAVVMVVGAPPARAEELRAQVWKSWTVKRPR
jgi:hypothetical protein